MWLLEGCWPYAPSAESERPSLIRPSGAIRQPPLPPVVLQPVSGSGGVDQAAGGSRLKAHRPSGAALARLQAILSVAASIAGGVRRIGGTARSRFGVDATPPRPHAAVVVEYWICCVPEKRARDRTDHLPVSRFHLQQTRKEHRLSATVGTGAQF